MGGLFGAMGGYIGSFLQVNLIRSYRLFKAKLNLPNQARTRVRNAGRAGVTQVGDAQPLSQVIDELRRAFGFVVLVNRNPQAPGSFQSQRAKQLLAVARVLASHAIDLA